jgi:hypothetical protein
MPIAAMPYLVHDEEIRALDASEIGWRLGQHAFEAGMPVSVVTLRMCERARTFVARTAMSLTPRERVQLAEAFADGYMGAALQSAFAWAIDHGDEALAAEARAWVWHRWWAP